MKRLLFLSSLLLLCLAYKGSAQCLTWQAVGNVDDTNQPSFGQADFQAIAIDFNNPQPYVIYKDAMAGNKASVATLKASKWVYVGGEGFSIGTVQYTTIQIGQLSHNVYCAYSDATVSGGGAVVKMLSGLSWTPLGPPASSGSASYISMAIAHASGNDTVYLAYADGAHSNKLSVVKYKGGSWVNVGAPGFSNGAVTSISLQYDNGSSTPYVVYSDASLGNKAVARKFSGVAWSYIVTSGGFTKKGASSLSMGLNLPNIYVAYIDSNALGMDSGVVMQTTGASWNPLGNAPSSYAFTPGQATDMSLTMEGSTGNFFVAFADGNTGGYATVMQHTAAGGWNVFGTPDFSAGSVHNTGIVTDKTLWPHVVYQDLKADNKTTVMAYNGIDWINQCTQGISGDAYAFNPSIAIDKKKGIEYVAFEDALKSNFNTTVMQCTGIGGPWSYTGGRDSVSTAYTRYPCIALDKSGVPYVAYQDDNTGSTPFLKYFNGGNWYPLSGTGQVSPASINYIALAIDTINNIPYVAFDDGSVSNKATVMKWNGSVWAAAGTKGFTNPNIQYVGIAIDTIAPYIIYSDAFAGGKAIVKRFNGATWSTVGASSLPIAATTSYNCIAIDKSTGIPYIAFTGAAGDANVWKYSGGIWTNMSSGLPTLYTSSTRIIPDDLGNLYLSYIDASNSDRVTVMKYSSSSGGWSIAGTANISQGAANGYMGMAIDGAGNPYVTYQDRGAVVKEFNACNSSGGPVVTITSNPANDTICQGSKAILTATATGGGAKNYVWSTGATTSSISVSPPTGKYTYTVTVTDSLGSGKDSIQIVVQPKFTLTITPPNATICKGGSVTLNAPPSLSTYSWSPSTALSSTSTQFVTASPAATTTYTLVASVLGCYEKDSVKVSVIPPPTITITPIPPPPICPGSSIKLTAAGASTYFWSTTAATASITVTPSSTTTYTVTGTTSAGCSAKDSIVVTVNPAMTITFTSVGIIQCNGGNTGVSATVTGGTPGYTYSWAPSGGTSASANNLTAATYTLTVTDKSGCTAKDSITISQPPPIVITSFSQNNITCFGGSNGNASPNVSGGTPTYTYAWSDGQTTSTASGLSAGTYTVNIKDANGCGPVTDVVTITEPTQLRDSVNSVTNETCFGGNNGSATAAVKGGTPGYTYLWSDGESTQNATNLTAGNYTVTVTDKGGCTAKATVNITEPTQLRDSASAQTNELCFGGNNGSATIGVKGGTPGYTYSWNSGQTTSTVSSGLTAGTYIITVTDKSGCNSNVTVIITQPSAPLVASSSSVQACTTGTLTTTINPGGGTPPYTYSWSPTGGTGATASGLSSGFYICTITDQNGCKDTAGANVGIYSSPGLSVWGTTSVCNGTPATLGDSISGGASPYTFAWTPTTGLSCNTCRFPIATPSVTTTYMLTVTDACGKKASGNVTITILAAPTLSLCCDTTIFLGQSVQLSATASGSGNTFAWGPTTGLSCNTCPNPIATPSSTTVYFVSVTNTADPCTARDSVLIQIGSSTLIFYTGISPNGDGHNDTWIIDNITDYPKNTAVIYNRWGTEVWRGTNYNNTSVVWKGFNEQGQPLPDGTYFYAVTINTKVYKGWVQLTR